MKPVPDNPDADRQRTATTPQNSSIEGPDTQSGIDDVLRFMICSSTKDGAHTLIDRLLSDLNSIPPTCETSELEDFELVVM